MSTTQLHIDLSMNISHPLHLQFNKKHSYWYTGHTLITVAEPLQPHRLVTPLLQSLGHNCGCNLLQELFLIEHVLKKTFGDYIAGG